MAVEDYGKLLHLMRSKQMKLLRYGSSVVMAIFGVIFLAAIFIISNKSGFKYSFIFASVGMAGNCFLLASLGLEKMILKIIEQQKVRKIFFMSLVFSTALVTICAPIAMTQLSH